MTAVLLDPPKVRTSERTNLMRCEQQWYWAYVERLKAKGIAPPLVFGDLIHRALAEFYIPETSERRNSKQKPKRGPHPVQTFQTIYRKEGHDFGWGKEDNFVDAYDMGTEMLTNYIDFYGLDPNVYIISPEIPFQVPIRVKGRTIAIYVGTCDALMRYLPTWQLGFLETKTAKGLSTDHLGFDEQAGSYWTYGPSLLRKMGLLKKGEDVDFIMYNFLKKAWKDTRTQNEKGQYLNLPTKAEKKMFGEDYPGSVSKRQPGPLFHRHIVRRAMHERHSLHERVVRQVQLMDELRTGKRKPMKSILNGCSGMYRCQFREMCELHETGDDWEGYKKMAMTTWEPYEVHEGMRDDGEGVA